MSGPLLAIGIDAAEPTLVRRLIDRGELPALARLLAEGTWRRVASPAAIGSGAVWPTFFTGASPVDHGMYSYLRWDPAKMRLADYDEQRFTPFWQELVRRGIPVGVLDVPFAPFIGITDGFEVSEWGAHDIIHGRPRISPPSVSGLVTATVPSHPFMSGRDQVESSSDVRGRAAVYQACIEGARDRGTLAARLIAEKRPTLTLVVFGEVHRAGHHLWHTIDPHDPLYAGAGFDREADVTDLVAVYREVDRQVERLVDTAAPDSTIVFSLHGMRPGRGVATLLDPVLREHGFTHLRRIGQQSWSERGSILSAARRLAPPGLKQLYRRLFSHATRHRWRRSESLPAYDWPRTRAFALPTDQHGWIRINLRGREAAGIVEPGDYERTCGEVEAVLRGLRTSDGRSLVRAVLRPSPDPGSASTGALPDLVVHWEPAALEDATSADGRVPASAPTATHLTGQHAFDGFCIVQSASSLTRTDAPIAVEDLHRLMSDLSAPA